MTDDTRTYDRWSDNDFDIDDLMRPAPIVAMTQQSSADSGG